MTYIANLLAQVKATWWGISNHLIRSGEEVSTIPIEFSILPGLLMLTPVLLTCCRVMNVHTPPDAAYATISFIAGIESVGGVNIIDTIPGVVLGGK